MIGATGLAATMPGLRMRNQGSKEKTADGIIHPCKKGDIFLISYSRKICRVFLAGKIAEQPPRLVSGVLRFVPKEISINMINIF